MKRFRLYALGVVLLAFALREWFILTAVIPNPEQGDVVSYLRYALHLLLDGTFSQAGNVPNPAPDAFRGPGYPLFLAVVNKLVGWEAWYAAICHAQAVLGAATVAGVIALARRWLATGWALLAGLVLAVQPHNIVASGVMLTEVLFGFLIVSGLLASVLALDRRSLRIAALAGALFGFGYLVNPVIVFFPLLAVAWLWRAGSGRAGVVLLVVSFTFVGTWSARNAAQGLDGGGRAEMNIVQGSWPTFHAAWKWHRQIPEAKRELDAINREVGALMAGDAEPTLRRLSEHPATSARWFLLEKPYLLWDWDIRVGYGGPYSIFVASSMLDSVPAMRWILAVQKALNPIMFALAFVGLFAAWRRPAAWGVALFVVYITAVHVVFQAEPRYSIAYRGPEILLAVTALAWLATWVKERKGLERGVPDARQSPASNAERPL